MQSVLDTLSNWTRRTTSSFAQMRGQAVRDEPCHSGTGPAYRLRHWPHLPSSCRIAPIYRMLSVMSCRVVNRHWMVRRSGLPAAQVDRLLQHLIARGAVQVIDTANFPAGELADLV